MNVDAKRFLADIAKRHSRLYSANLSDMVVASATGRKQAFEDARARFAATSRETFGVCEILGAESILQSAALAARTLKFAAPPKQTILPNVTFREALENFVRRAPVTFKDAAERTAEAISRAYSRGNVVGFVKAAEETVTLKAQEIIAKAIQGGIDEVNAARELTRQVEAIRQFSEPWSEAYARMAFRTNLGTATTAGRFRQVQDPDVRDIVPAFTIQTAGDSDVRPDHAKLHGVIFNQANPVWNRISTPLDYNCRCDMRPVTVMQLRRMGRLNTDGTVKESPIPSWTPPLSFRSGRGDILTGLVA